MDAEHVCQIEVGEDVPPLKTRKALTGGEVGLDILDGSTCAHRFLFPNVGEAHTEV